MPIYEYRCLNCGYKCEFLQNSKDKPKKICPKCNKDKLERYISLSSFQLKGKGWYKTDYKKSENMKAKDTKSD